MAKKSSKKKSSGSGDNGKSSDAGTPSNVEGQETTDKSGARGWGGDRSQLEGALSPRIETGGDVMEERETGVSDGYQTPDVGSLEETAEETVKGKDEENVRRVSARGRKPSSIIIPGGTSEDSPIKDRTLCPPEIKEIIKSAEAYIHWADHNSDALITTDKSSAIRFEAILQHLHNAKMAPEPSSPLDDDAPDSTCSPPIPEELNAEFGEVYFLCQKLIDERTAGNTDVTEHDIWLLKDQIDVCFLNMSKETNLTATQARRMSDREAKMSILLARMFKGLAKHHPFLKKKVTLVEGVALNTDEELPIFGFNIIVNSVKTSLPDLREFSDAGKMAITIVLLTVFWLSAWWFLFTWMLWAFSIAKNGGQTTGSKGFEDLPGFRNSRDSANPWTPFFDSSAGTLATNCNASSWYYHAAYENATTSIEKILNLTESLTVDLQHLAFQSFWSGVAVFSPIQRVLNLDPPSNTAQAIKNTTRKYLDDIENLTSHFPVSKRTLQNAFDSLDASLRAFNSSTTRANSLVKVFNRFKLSTNPYDKKKAFNFTRTDDELMLIIKRAVDSTRRAAEERLFVMYEEVEGFERRAKRDIEGGEESGWWRVAYGMKKAGKLLKGSVAGITKGNEEWVAREKEDVAALFEEGETKKTKAEP